MRADVVDVAADVAADAASAVVAAAGVVVVVVAGAPGAIGRGAAVVTSASKLCPQTNDNEPAAQAAGFVL
jgi:hypothetical protein